MASRVAVVLTVCLLLAGAASAFYLPGTAPINFEENAPVDLKVNKLSSVHDLAFDYYDKKLPFCKPATIDSDYTENLGEVLSGETIHNSNYVLSMKHDDYCMVLDCPDADNAEKSYSAEEMAKFAKLATSAYRAHWILDNLPGAEPVTDKDGKEMLENGFYVGGVDTATQRPYINNHVRLTVKYHTDPSYANFYRIVRFLVTPYSVHHILKEQWAIPQSATGGARTTKAPVETCNKVVRGEAVSKQFVDAPGKITFTYDVVWEEDPNTPWATRWDAYLSMKGDEEIHWFSIINSLMIALFLTGMVAMIMMRTLHRDINRYNQMAESEEAQEETGWKLVHGDVFRPPGHPALLAVFVGTGVQVFFMAVIVLVFAVLGFLSPANRGGLLTALLVLFVFMGVFAGYHSARIYKMFKGLNWKRTTLLTGFLWPGCMLLIFLIIDFFAVGAGSSQAVPFGTFAALVGMWFGISVPAVFLGAYFGFKKQAIEQPVRTNQIPRQIPEQVWYMRPIFSILMGGILPFGAVFIELFFILSSVWMQQFYYIFGFLFIVFCILLITCSEITIVMCYFQLCSEDYHWWWRSFLTSGASALYMFLYSIFYFVTRLSIFSVEAGFTFFGYTLMMSLTFFLLTGTIGFYATFWFVRKIYSAVKVD